MNRYIFILLLLSTGSFLLPDSGSAQARSQTREGFFMGIGLGWASLGCSDCGGEREPGASGYLKLGGTVSPRLLLGFELDAWTREENGVMLSQGNASAVAFFYPRAEGGFFLKAGFGLSTLDLGVSEFGRDSPAGLGLTAGAGVDLRVGTNVSLTPFANVLYGQYDEGSTNLLQAGLGLSWH